MALLRLSLWLCHCCYVTFDTELIHSKQRPDLHQIRWQLPHSTSNDHPGMSQHSTCELCLWHHRTSSFLLSIFSALLLAYYRGFGMFVYGRRSVLSSVFSFIFSLKRDAERTQKKVSQNEQQTLFSYLCLRISSFLLFAFLLMNVRRNVFPNFFLVL